MNLLQSHLGRRLAVALLFSVVSAGALGAGVPVASGQLILDLGSNNQWRFGEQRQSLTTAPGNRCDLLAYPQSGPDQLVTLSGSSPGVGFLAKRGKELIGIVGPGVDCGRINVQEHLDLTLAGSLADRVFTRVALALNVKGNAVLRGIAYDDAAGTSQTFKLYTGRSIPAILNPDTEAKCAEGSDSSPDDDSTNCHWTIPGTGNRLRLEVLAGEVGIGGAGSTSVFEISRIVPSTGEPLGCGDSTISTQFLNTSEGSNATVRCQRKDNLDASSCEEVAYSLVATCENGTCSTTFLHALEQDDPTNTTKYEFICETWWPEQSAQFLGGSFVLPKSQQYFGPNELQGTDLDFCENVTPIFDASADCLFGSGGAVDFCPIDDIQTVTVPLALDHQPVVPGQQVGCLLDERVRQIEDPFGETDFKHYQMWVLKGDYRVSRAF